MKAVAAFAMTSRRNAIVAVLGLGVLPILGLLSAVPLLVVLLSMASLLSAAVVALVCMQQGAAEGFKVLVWALLPTLVWAVSGLILPMAVVLGTFMLALVLSSTKSWELSLLSSVLVGLGVLMYVFITPGFFDALRPALEQVFQESPELSEVFLVDGIDTLLNELAYGFCIGVMLYSVLLLMLARSWQAGLYNPGGFQKEFHQVRLSLKSALILLAVTAAGVVLGNSPALASFGLIPIFLVGLGLMHGIVAMKNWPVGFLVILYATMVTGYTVLFVIMMALLDSVMNFRKRLAQQ
ncbi:MAG: hypothetical protein R3332_03500 [Pseudohongiellaceae bacterium]|nr:hypothetical protein [Pseudohongiellaceae bacterium]